MSRIKGVLLVGFSPLLVALEPLARERGAAVHLAFGPRQRGEWQSIPEGPGFIAGSLDSVMESDDFDEIVTELHLDDSWLVVSMGAPFLFRDRHLNAVSGQAINVHGAPLPEYRGGGGYSWRIMNADRRGAVLIHQVTPGIDDGPLLHRRDYLFPKELTTPGDFQAYAREQDAPALIALVGEILDRGELPNPVEQTGNPTYFPRLATDIHGAIDWTWDAPDLVTFIRAFSDPYAGAFTQCRGARARISASESIAWTRSVPHPFMAGLLVAEDHDHWIVAARGGYLRIRLHSEGELPPRIGDRLHTPIEWLENSLSTRVEYLPDGLVVRDGRAPRPKST